MLDYLIELRETCLDAFTGIIQGLKDDNSNNNDIQRLQPHLQFIFQFLSQVANDKDELSDSLLSSSVGLIGDISMSFGYLGNQLVDLCKEEPIQFLLNSGIKSKNVKTKILCQTTHNSLALFARFARSLAPDCFQPRRWITIICSLYCTDAQKSKILILSKLGR